MWKVGCNVDDEYATCNESMCSLLFEYRQLPRILICFPSILFCNNSQDCFKRVFSLAHSSVVMSSLIEIGEFRELLFDRIH